MSTHDLFLNEYVHWGFMLGAACVAGSDVIRYAAKGVFRILKYLHTLTFIVESKNWKLPFDQEAK